MNTNAPLLDALSNRIIGCAITVSNALGIGFLERVYENALAIELREAGLVVAQQYGVTVTYRGRTIGEYVAGLLVGDAILVELKIVRALERAQCLNYLRATGLQLCLLINFGTPRLEIRRIVLDLRGAHHGSQRHAAFAFICGLCVHLRYIFLKPATRAVEGV